MDVRVIKSREEFAALRGAWDALYATQKLHNPFLSWAWLDLWLKHFSAQEQWLIVVAEQEGRLIGAAPLYYIGRDLHFIGDPMLSDYMDFLTDPAHEASAVNALFNQIKTLSWRRVVLKRFHDGDMRTSLVCDAAKATGLTACRRINCESPYVQFSQDWDGYYKSLSKKLRKDLRLTMNKLEAMGRIKFDTASIDGVDTAMQSLKRFHQGRQEQKVGTSLFEDETIYAFLTDVANQDWGDVSTISLDGRVISVVFGLHGDDRFFYWIPSFDEAYFQYSLGKHHLKYLVERSCNSGLKKFDFLIGDEDYKMRWATGTLPNYEVTVFRSGLSALLYTVKISLRQKLKAMKNNSRLLSKLWLWVSKVRG